MGTMSDRMRSQSISVKLAQATYNPNISGLQHGYHVINLHSLPPLGDGTRICLADLLKPASWASSEMLRELDIVRVVDKTNGLDIDLAVVEKHTAGAVLKPRGVDAKQIAAIAATLTEANTARADELKASLDEERAAINEERLARRGAA